MTDFQALVGMALVVVAAVCTARAIAWLARRRPAGPEPHEHLPDGWDRRS